MKKITQSNLASPSTPSAIVRKQRPRVQDGSWLRWCLDHAVLCFAVAAAVWVLALYWRVLRAPFVYDDLDQIVNNGSLASWHATFVRFFLAPVSFTTGLLGVGGSTYRPLYWLTLLCDYQMWGVTGVRGFHFTNLLFHWANGVVLFQLLRRMRVETLTAAVASALWLGLPINTEAVAWVSGRAYLLSTFFLLLSLLSACFYVSARRPVWLACCFVFALGAVFSHEQGYLLLPLMMVLLYGMGERDRAVWGTLTVAPLVAAVLYVLAKYRVGAHGGQGKAALWSIGTVFWKYGIWMLAPVHMSVERSTSLPSNVASMAAVVAWVGLVALVGVVVLLRRRVPVVAGGVVCGCVALLPFCGVVAIYQGMAERFLYLASMGFVVAIVSLALAYRTVWRGVAVGGLLLWTMWGAWRVTSRVTDWGDPVRLYQSSVVATPKSPTLFYNLGYSLRERGRLNEALVAYGEATRILPTYAQAFSAIGDVYGMMGKPTEAVKAYDHALLLHPNDASALINNAVAMEQTGNKVLAEERLKQAIAVAPKDGAALIDLGSLYAQENRVDEAIQCFQRAIDLNPNDAAPYFDMAVLLQWKGQDDVALAFYKKVLRLKPDDPETLMNMSKLHAQPSGS